MKTFGTMAIAALAAFLMPATTAYADGVGGYIEYSGYADTVDFPGAGKLDQNGNSIGVGVTYSTNPQGDHLFNYRLDAGYVHTWDEVGASGTNNWNGFSMNNAFGFRVFQDSSTRVWIGPAVGFGFDALADSGPGPDIYTFSIGGGPQIGVNLATSESLTVAFTAGYQYRYRHVWNTDSDFDDGADGHGSYWLANVAMMFNTGS